MSVRFWTPAVATAECTAAVPSLRRTTSIIPQDSVLRLLDGPERTADESMGNPRFREVGGVSSWRRPLMKRPQPSIATELLSGTPELQHAVSASKRRVIVESANENRRSISHRLPVWVSHRG